MTCSLFVFMRHRADHFTKSGHKPARERNNKKGNSVTDQNSQQGNDQAGGIENGIEKEEGYYSMFHRVEEMIYGPESPVSAKDKILHYLKHSELRWPENHPLGLPKTKAQIAEHTGLTLRQIEWAVNELIKTKFIERIHMKIDGIHIPTTYRLNRTTFGHLRVPKKEEFTLIQGGRGTPASSGPPPDLRGTLPRNPPYQTGLSSGNNSGISTLNKGVQTKGLKNTKTGGSVVVSKGIPWEKAKPTLLRAYPQDGKRLDEAYAQISQAQSYRKTPVRNAAGFLLKGWQYIRDDFAYVDEIERQKQIESRPFEEPPATPEEHENAMRVRMMIRGLPRMPGKKADSG